MPYLGRASNASAKIYLYADEPEWTEQTICGVCGASLGYWSDKGKSQACVLLEHYQVPSIKPGDCFEVDLVVKND